MHHYKFLYTSQYIMNKPIHKKIILAIKMPMKQKILFGINWILCGIAKSCIKLCAYKTIARYFGKNYKMLQASTVLSTKQIKQACAIKRAVRLAAKYTPWDSSCLTQAMVAKFWCKYYNIPYMFFIGLPITRTKPLGKEAHAWTTSGPVFITGGNSFGTHTVIATYSNL
jgi:hypothetical protein